MASVNMTNKADPFRDPTNQEFVVPTGMVPRPSTTRCVVPTHQAGGLHDFAGGLHDFIELGNILDEVYDQAAFGKGQERHANSKPWTQQPWVGIAESHGVGFLTGQADKKAREAHGMDTAAACREMLGAMHYLAMAIHYRRTHDESDAN